jgi:hypothetical protein
LFALLRPPSVLLFRERRDGVLEFGWRERGYEWDIETYKRRRKLGNGVVLCLYRTINGRMGRNCRAGLDLFLA